MRISTSTRTTGTGAGERAKSSSSQTLVRGLDVIEAAADGTISLADLAAAVGLNRSTTHRLASALVDRQYLNFLPREGYTLGPRLLELGFKAQQQKDLPRVARPYLEALAAATEDTIHLGVMDDGRALYLDKIPGRRRIEISSRVGERQPLRSTGLGKALLLDETEARWCERFDAEEAIARSALDRDEWLVRMRAYAAAGHAFDLEENEDRIRCVAAPIRDVGGRVVGAISLSSAAQYMDDRRMASLPQEVRATAEAISRELGWREDTVRSAGPAPRPKRSSRN
jgi:DNA-binding IclR family transcriptional regulator